MAPADKGQGKGKGKTPAAPVSRRPERGSRWITRQRPDDSPPLRCNGKGGERDYLLHKDGHTEAIGSPVGNRTEPVRRKPRYDESEDAESSRQAQERQKAAAAGKGGAVYSQLHLSFDSCRGGPSKRSSQSQPQKGSKLPKLKVQAAPAERQTDVRSFFARARDKSPSPKADTRRMALQPGPVTSDTTPVTYPHRKGLFGPTADEIRASQDARPPRKRRQSREEREEEEAQSSSEAEMEDEEEASSPPPLPPPPPPRLAPARRPRHTEPLPMRPALAPDSPEQTLAVAAPAWEAYVNPHRMNELRKMNGFSISETQELRGNQWLDEHGLVREPGGPRAQALAPTQRTAKRLDKEWSEKVDQKMVEIAEEQLAREQQRRASQEEEPAVQPKTPRRSPTAARFATPSTARTPSEHSHSPQHALSSSMPQLSPHLKARADTLAVGPLGKKIYAVDTALSPGFDNGQETQLLDPVIGDTDSEASPVKVPPRMSNPAARPADSATAMEEQRRLNAAGPEDEETQPVGFPFSEYDEDDETTPVRMPRRAVPDGSPENPAPRVLVAETLASPIAKRPAAAPRASAGATLAARHAQQYATFDGQPLVLPDTAMFDSETLDMNATTVNTLQQSKLSRYGFASPKKVEAPAGPVQFKELPEGLCEELSEDEEYGNAETLPQQRAERRDLARMEEERQAALAANRLSGERPPLARADTNQSSLVTLSSEGSDGLKWLPKHLSTPVRGLLFPELESDA